MRSVGWLLAALALTACVAPPQPQHQEVQAPQEQVYTEALTAVPFSAVPGWREDRLSDAMPAVQAGCAQLTGMAASKSLGGDAAAVRRGGSAGQWRSLCAAAARVPPGDDAATRAMLERELQPYVIASNGQTQGLFTGYYEPLAEGSLRRGGRYQTPLLRKPRGPVHADRAAIERGAMASQHLELLYLADPIDAFFIEIQGAGRVHLPDGRIVRVSYDGQNGYPYVPIGRLLIDRGELTREEVSLQTIRAWLVAHPRQAPALMDANPSYVFFTVLPDAPADQGPPGAFGVALTPGRSLAVDRSFLPMGAPVFVATTSPVDGSAWRHLLLAQDTGGAIKGPIRGDIFFGWGAEATEMAGRMKQPGRAYLLLPRATPGV
jgi:membrane-bound lytic murein transglycosylase A